MVAEGGQEIANHEEIELTERQGDGKQIANFAPTNPA